MGAAVLLHGVSIAEAAAADGAAVRPLAGVDAQVAPQVPALAKTAGTDSAAVRPLARVRPQVTPQVGRLGEGLAAPLAGVALPAALLQVEQQAGGLGEGLAAAPALVDGLSCSASPSYPSSWGSWGRGKV